MKPIKDISDAHGVLGPDGLKTWLLAVAATNPTEDSPMPASAVSAESAPESYNADSADSVPEGSIETISFPLDCLDQKSAAMAREAATTALVPEALTSCSALALISAAIGAGLEVVSGGNRRTRANLFILAVAESGTGKGTAFGIMAEPLLRLEREALEDWRINTRPDLLAKRTVAEQRIAALKSRAKKLKGDDDPGPVLKSLKSLETELAGIKAEMVEPCWTMGDCTREALENLLSQAPNEALASLSPEARGVLDVLAGRYRAGISDESVYLSGYTGESYIVHRKCSPPVLLSRPCVTVLWMVQPDKHREIMSKPQLAESGLFPRFLMCDTKAEPHEEPEVRVTISAETAESWENLIEDLVCAYRKPSGAPRVITPTAGAVAVLRDYFNSVVRQRKTGGILHDVASYAARWGEQAWRLAVVLHAGEHGAKSHDTHLSEDTSRRAVRLAEWFAAQQLTVLATSRLERRDQLKQKVTTALESYPDRKATLRDLQRRNGIRRDEVEAVAKHYPHVLAIQTVRTGKAGQPSEGAKLI